MTVLAAHFSTCAWRRQGRVKMAGLAVSLLYLTSVSAAAASDIYTGDGTNNPNSVPPQRTHGPDHCPAGMAPMIWNGAISCGRIGFPVARDKPLPPEQIYVPTRIHTP